MYQRLGLVLAGEAKVSVFSRYQEADVAISSRYPALTSRTQDEYCLLRMDVANWYTYVCRVRYYKPLVINHINASGGNEHEK